MKPDSPRPSEPAAWPPEAGEARERPSGSSAGRRTILLALVAVGAVIVGAVGTSMVLDGGRSPSAGGLADGPARLDAGPRSGVEQRPLPDMELAGFADGPGIDLSDYRGAPLIVNFWATWCAPCVEEMPDIQRVADALAGQAAVLGVNTQDAARNAEPFVAELGVTYDLATDPQGDLYSDVRGFGMPTTLLVDEHGTIVYRHTGPLDDTALRGLAVDHLGVDE